MLDTPQERNALLDALRALNGGITDRRLPRDLPADVYWDQARRDIRAGGTLNVDDYHDVVLKLLTSSPDHLLPEWALVERDWIDRELWKLVTEFQALPDVSPRLKKLDKRMKRLLDDREKAENCATAWLRTVLFNMTRDRIRADKRHDRILRAHSPELADLFHSGIGESAESIVMRKLAEEDIKRRILRLPPALSQVAAPMYAGYSGVEIAQILGIKEAAVWKRAERIRSPRIRGALGL